MEKLKGGNVLIDLTNVTLAIGTETSISDAEVLEHFKELYPLVRNGSPKNLIFVKVSDASEEIIVPCEHVIDGNNLEIRGKVYADANTSYGLVIDITYSVGDYDAISVTSCKYTYSGDLVLDGEILDANGNSAIDVGTSDVTISKNVNIGNTGSTKDLYVSGKLEVDGDVTINSDLAVDGAITGDSIIENMSGYSFTKNSSAYWNAIYVGVSKTGNKLTIVIFGNVTFDSDTMTDTAPQVATINIPEEIGQKLYPFSIGGSAENVLDLKPLYFYQDVSTKVECEANFRKYSDTSLNLVVRKFNTLVDGTTYCFRYEGTFLLSDNFAE